MHVQSGSRTPLQKVLQGDQTIEGFMFGKGTLTVKAAEGTVREYNYPGDQEQVVVDVGQTMQWHAKEDLTFYELCWPPYQDGRYQNL